MADVPMAGLTRHLSQDHMASMGEKNVIRLPVDVSPWDLLLLFFKLPDSFFFRVICDGFFVAFKADGDVRQSGKGLGLEIAVTGIAL